MEQFEVLMQTPLAQSVVPILIVAIIICFVVKAAKGFVKFLIGTAIVAALMIYVVPMFT